MPWFKRRALVSILSGFLLVAGLLSAGIAEAGPASALPQITICLTNAPQYCADVENSVNKSGQPIWLYSPAGGARDYHWYEAQVPCGMSTCLCGGTNCVEFEDAQNPSLCLAASGAQGTELINCELGLGGTGRAAWTQNGNYLRNFFWTAEDLTVLGPLKNGIGLYVAHQVSPGTNQWQQWSGP